MASRGSIVVPAPKSDAYRRAPGSPWSGHLWFGRRLPGLRIELSAGYPDRKFDEAKRRTGEHLRDFMLDVVFKPLDECIPQVVRILAGLDLDEPAAEKKADADLIRFIAKIASRRQRDLVKCPEC